MKLKEIRESLHMSQGLLAINSGVNLRSIQKYESGERAINKASAENIYKLSKVLGCTMEDLLEGLD